MKNLIEAVEQFNKLAGIPMPLAPKRLTTDDLFLRQKLHCEENVEFDEELQKQNAPGILHEGLDNIWIILATMMQSGIQRGAILEAIEHMIDVNLSKVDGRFGPIKRREDGKILKPDGFKPVDMKHLLTEYIFRQIEGSHDVG